jgi:predicted RNA-binding protein associated with RNAse of E/G family
VEKYFTATGDPLGYYIPVCMPIEQQNNRLSTASLGLALWVDAAGRVTVLGEPAFDAAIDAGDISPVAEEQAEQRIRELTALTAQRLFPPALVRNFAIVIEQTESGRLD